MATGETAGHARPMSRPYRARVAVIAAAWLVLLGTWLMLARHETGAIDQFAFRVLALPSHGVAAAAPTVVAAAKAVLAAAALIVLGLLARQRAWWDCVAIAVGAPVAQAAAHLAKDAVARPRPEHELVRAGGYSFPSSTSALGMGFAFLAIALARALPARRRAITAAGALVTLALGLSFVALRVHYLSDVIAGWALGVIAYALCGLAPELRRHHAS
jgi:membrane-associated phospholipid phosphatase